MSATSWSVLNDDDDEPTQTVSVSGVGSDAAATGEKKKRKKNKKKGDKSEKSGEEAAGSDVKLSTTGVLEDVVAKAAALGFKRAAVEAAIDAMWNEQLPYDDPNAVIARLQGKPWPPAAQPQTQTAAVPPAPAPSKPAQEPSGKANRRASDIAKPAQNAKAAAPAPAPVAAPAPAPVEATPAAIETPSQSVANPTEALKKTLEDSCKLPNISAVLESLTVWSHRASEADLDILCSCNAFPYLFSTLLRRPLRTDVENKLKGFLETTLAKSAAPSSPVVAVVKTATAAVCMQLRAAIGAITELINGVEGSPAAEEAISAVARRLAGSLVGFRAIVARQLRAPESSRVSTRNHVPKPSPRALTGLDGSGADPAALFRARDVLQQQSKGLFGVFSTVYGAFAVPSESDDASRGSAFSVSESQLQSSVNALVPEAHGDAKEKALAARDQLAKLRADHTAALAPLLESVGKVDGEAGRLRARRQELVKELEAIDEQLRGLQDQKSQVQKTAQDMDAKFVEKKAALDSESSGLSAIVSKLDAAPSLIKSLQKLTEELDSCKASLRSSTRASTSAAAVISSRAEYSDAVLAYLKVEQRCLDFLRQRVQLAQTNANKLKFEIARYEELGMSHVVKECASSAAKLNANITEDMNALAALGREAAAAVDSLRRAGVVDDDAVPLHPAEVVLHHRIRAVAAAAGVLLPTGADLAKQDFLTIPTVDENALWPLPSEPAGDDDALLPEMLATIGIAADSLGPLSASPVVADVNPGGSTETRKSVDSAPAPAPVAVPVAAPSPAKPTAVASPKRPAPAVAAIRSSTGTSSNTKAAWGSKRVEPAAPVSLKTIIQQESRAAGEPAVASTALSPASGAQPAPAVDNELEEGEIVEDKTATPAADATDAAALPQRGRKTRIRDN